MIEFKIQYGEIYRRITLSLQNVPIADLKSSMERFIDHLQKSTLACYFLLKSSMERFIASTEYPYLSVPVI